MPVVVKLEHLDKPWGFFVLLSFVGILFGCISHYYLLETSQHLTNQVFKECIILYFIHGQQRQKSGSYNAHTRPESIHLLILGAAFLSPFTFPFRTGSSCPQLWLHFNCLCTGDCRGSLSPSVFQTSTFWEELINVICLQHAGSVWNRWPNPGWGSPQVLVPLGHYLLNFAIDGAALLLRSH